MTRKIPSDYVWGAVLAAFSAALLWNSRDTGDVALGAASSAMGWPHIILWGLLILGLALIPYGWLGDRREDRPHTVSTGPASLRTTVFVGATGAAYFAGLDYLGFLVSTLAFGVILPKLLGRSGWRGPLAFSTIALTAFWIIFVKILNVPLPKGVGPFREVSLFFS
jgi:putative tricarboxylic transport membrane protein